MDDYFSLLHFLRNDTIHVAVTTRPDGLVEDLQESNSKLREQLRDLRFKNECLSTLLAKIRDFCRDNAISLPSGLSEVTPWEC